MASVEVFPGPERRRRWSDDQKRELVAAAFEPGAVVLDVAPSLIYRWRRDLRVEAGFARVIVASNDPPLTVPDRPVEIESAGQVRIQVPVSTPPALAAAIVQALARR